MTITDYRQFRDLEKAEVRLFSGARATLEAITPDPYSAFARLTDVDFGIRLTLPREGREDVTYTLWISESGKPMLKQSLIQQRMVYAALLRLPSVMGEMEPVEKELCDYLAGNGHPRTYQELLEMARHFAKMNQ